MARAVPTLKPINTTFPPDSALYKLWESELQYAKTKHSGYFWIDHNDFRSAEAEEDGLDSGDTIDHLLVAEHRKDYIRQLTDDTVAGSDYEGRRFECHCGFVEIGVLGPTEGMTR